MSIFTALHTFGAWVEKELAKLEKEAPAFEAIADATLKYVGPALSVIVGIVNPAAGSIVSAVIADAQKDLLAASGLIHDFGASPTVQSILNSTSSNLSALLTAGHITDAATVAKVQRVVAEIEGLIEATGLASTGSKAPAPESVPEPVSEPAV